MKILSAFMMVLLSMILRVLLYASGLLRPVISLRVLRLCCVVRFMICRVTVYVFRMAVCRIRGAVAFILRLRILLFRQCGVLILNAFVFCRGSSLVLLILSVIRRGLVRLLPSGRIMAMGQIVIMLLLLCTTIASADQKNPGPLYASRTMFKACPGDPVEVVDCNPFSIECEEIGPETWLYHITGGYRFAVEYWGDVTFGAGGECFTATQGVAIRGGKCGSFGVHTVEQLSDLGCNEERCGSIDMPDPVGGPDPFAATIPAGNSWELIDPVTGLSVCLVTATLEPIYPEPADPWPGNMYHLVFVKSGNCCSGIPPTPTPTPTPIPTPTPGPTPTPTPGPGDPTPTPGPTPTPTPGPGDPTPTPGPGGDPTPTPGPGGDPTPTPGPTATPTPSLTPTPTPTPPVTPTPTATPTVTPTATPTITPGPTGTPGPQNTPTSPQPPGPGPTPYPTFTPSPTGTPGHTPAPTHTPGPGPEPPTPTSPGGGAHDGCVGRNDIRRGGFFTYWVRNSVTTWRDGIPFNEKQWYMERVAIPEDADFRHIGIHKQNSSDRLVKEMVDWDAVARMDTNQNHLRETISQLASNDGENSVNKDSTVAPQVFYGSPIVTPDNCGVILYPSAAYQDRPGGAQGLFEVTQSGNPTHSNGMLGPGSTDDGASSITAAGGRIYEDLMGAGEAGGLSAFRVSTGNYVSRLRMAFDAANPSGTPEFWIIHIPLIMGSSVTVDLRKGVPGAPQFAFENLEAYAWVRWISGLTLYGWGIIRLYQIMHGGMFGRGGFFSAFGSVGSAVGGQGRDDLEFRAGLDLVSLPKQGPEGGPVRQGDGLW